MRSIIAPGVLLLWKGISSDRACRARSERREFVAFHPTWPLVYVASTPMTCCTSATTTNSPAAAMRIRSGLPATASSMKYRMICGLTSWRPMLVRISAEASATMPFCCRRYLSRRVPYSRTGTFVRGPVKRSINCATN